MAEKDVIEKLKKLSPKERIEKLKQLQKTNKEEIKKAQELITESEEQAAREEEAEKIPIPQLKAVDIGALFTSEEKDLFKVKRFVSERPREEISVEERPREARRLEEVAAEAPKLTEEEERAHAEYLAQLSQKPAEELREKVASIYSAVKEAGYISLAQRQELNDIDYATRRKMHDIEAGKYAEVTREAAREMVITERMKNWLQDSYGRR